MSQPREHAVLCVICHRSTWNVSAVCDAHPTAPAASPSAGTAGQPAPPIGGLATSEP